VEKHRKRKSLSLSPKNESGIAGPIHRMQQQLNAMEKKLDILIGQSSARPNEKNYTQANSYHRDRERHDSYHEDKTFTRVTCSDCSKECEVPFKPSGDRPIYCRECFSKHKKDNPFDATRNDKPKKRNFSWENHSDKKTKPFKKNESFFTRKKKRI